MIDLDDACRAPPPIARRRLRRLRAHRADCLIDSGRVRRCSPKADALCDGSDHDGLRCRRDRTKLVPIVEDDEALFDDHAWPRLEACASGAVWVDLISPGARPVRREPG